jgi:hypothetical protein
MIDENTTAIIIELKKIKKSIKKLYTQESDLTDD